MGRAPKNRCRRIGAGRAAPLLAAALSGTALAQAPHPFELEWSAPASCPERRAVLDEAERLLAMSPGAGGAAAVQARAVLSQQGAVWALDLEILSAVGPGRRRFQDGSCERLAHVAALALALAVGPPTPPPPKTLESRAPPGAPAPPRYLVRAILGGDFGSLRAPGPGPGVAFGVFLGRARVEAALAYWTAQPAAGPRDQLLSGGLRACTELVEHPELDLCLGAELGRLRAGASGGGGATAGAWLALLAGPALGFELTPWLAARLEIHLGAALLRPALDGAAPEGQGASSNFARVCAGLEARF